MTDPKDTTCADCWKGYDKLPCIWPDRLPRLKKAELISMIEGYQKKTNIALDILVGYCVDEENGCEVMLNCNGDDCDIGAAISVLHGHSKQEPEWELGNIIRMKRKDKS